MYPSGGKLSNISNIDISREPVRVSVNSVQSRAVSGDELQGTGAPVVRIHGEVVTVSLTLLAVRLSAST